MRVTFLTVGDRTAASSRVRAYDLAAELARRGWQTRVRPVGRGPLARLRSLAAAARGGDVVVLQKVTPAGPVLRLIRRRAGVLVWECDDAVHLGYPGEDAATVRRRRRRIDSLRRSIDLLTTTNDLLAAELVPGRGGVLVFPGPAPETGPQQTPAGRVLLWTGSASTEAGLALLGEDVARLVSAGWRCVAVGAGQAARTMGWEVHDWSPTVERHWLAQATVGVMPQSRNAWNDRKAGYKVLQYLAAGVVPVVSPSPAAETALGPAEAGVFVSGERSWSQAVAMAERDRERLLANGAGRLAELSIARWADAWLAHVSTGA